MPVVVAILSVHQHELLCTLTLLKYTVLHMSWDTLWVSCQQNAFLSSVTHVCLCGRCALGIAIA